MQNRKINGLHPVLQRRVIAFLNECKKSGLKVAVIETTRTAEVQAAYYAQGRQPLHVVNDLRIAAGLWEITEKENKKTVTNCDGYKNKSNHQVKSDGYGYAVDIVPVDDRGRVLWSAPQQTWEEIGLIGERCGLDWCAGGRGAIWGKGWDNPHYEYNPDM